MIGFWLRQTILELSHANEKGHSNFRLVDWWWGACIFTALWVGIHFFAPFNQTAIWLSAVCILFIGLPKYWSRKAPRILFDEVVQTVKYYWIGLLPLLLLLKPLYFRLSLPPLIWDELAYHIWSPARVIFEQRWEFVLDRFTNVIYEMFPRTLETLMIVLFSATQSYAVGKFFQVFLYISVVLIIARIISDVTKNKIGANIWLFFLIFVSRGMIYQAGTAYIDIGAAASLMLVVATSWYWIQKPTIYRWLLICLSIGCAMGTKYSVLPGILSVILALLIFRVRSWKLLKKISINHWVRILGASIALWFIAGGYWYFKNLLISGNPFWPFFNFALGIKDCCDGKMVIEGWGYVPFNFENSWNIINAVIGNNMLAWWIGSFLILILGWKLIGKQATLAVKFYGFIVLITAIEVLLSLKEGLFAPRFYQHWYMYKYICLVIPLVLLPTLPPIRLKKSTHFLTALRTSYSSTSLTAKIGHALGILWLVLIIFFSSSYVTNEAIESINSLKELDISENDRWVVRQKMSISDWIHPSMPHAYPMILWCSDLSSGPQDIYSADVEMIIGPYGLSRVYLSRCLIKEAILIPGESFDETVNRITSSTPNFTYFSSLTCKQSQEQNLNNLNTAFVCRGEEFEPQLYRFN